jgi:alpha-galactosidase
VAGPILVDVTLPCTSTTTLVTLHHQLGSSASPTDFSAIDTLLQPGATISLTVDGGRSSEGHLPVWNLEVGGGGGGGGGVVVALGWSGNWAARCTRAADGLSVRLVVTPGTLCASLRPGETISLGRALTVPYKGTDYRLGYVLLRRLMAAHKVPRLGDGTLPHYLATESYDRWPESDPAFGPDGVRNQSNARWVQTLAASGGLDTYWMDANCTVLVFR